MSAVAVLSLVLALTFFVLGGWTLAQWLRWRRRSAAYLAVAFCSLAFAIAVSRLHSLTVIDVPWPWLLRVLNIALFAFPWLLAASVWSLEGRRPRWAWLGIVGVPLLSLWLLFAPVFGESMLVVEEAAMLALLALLWVVPAVATAVRLRRAARHHSLARPRMRLMAVGLLTLTAALLFDIVTRGSGSAVAEAIMNAVAVLAGAVFLFGFLPPRSLRAFWRRGSVAAFQRVQTDLLGAVSRRDVAEAVAGPLAELLGTGVLVVDEDATVLDQQGVDERQTSEIVDRLRDRQPLREGVRATSVGTGWLVVVTSPYTLVFGQDELDLVDAYAMQVRIALERAQLFESVRDQQRDLEAMLLGLAHDIRSPTAAISGSAQLLVDADDRGMRSELANLINNSTAYLERLVDAMMELGQVRTGEREREPVALGAVAREVAERVCAAHPQLAVEVSDDPATVVMNPVRAEQLFDNLVGNAAKHGGRDDLTISIEIAAVGSEVEVVVADNGVGITPADEERIFTPFQRGSTAQGVGNGLGLGLVRRIVDDLGGRLHLEASETGARFVLHLPANPVRLLASEHDRPVTG